MENLDEESRNKLNGFQEICAVDAVVAEQFLRRCNWDIELAVQEFINESEGRPSVMPQSRDSSSESEGSANLRRRNIQAQAPADVAHAPLMVRSSYKPPTRRQGWYEWFAGLVLLPFRFVWFSFIDLFSFVYRIFFPTLRAVTDPAGDVRRTVEAFEAKFGRRHPQFHVGSYSQALSDAKRDLRFLLIYLHSDDHEDTEKFCRDSLCNRDVIRFVDSNMMFWMCSVKFPEGMRVHQAMRETTYPFLALICLRESRMMMVLRREGYWAPDELIANLAIAIQDNETFLNVARQDRQQQAVAQQLRQQQEEDYLASLHADRERERAIQEAQRQQNEAQLAAKRDEEAKTLRRQEIQSRRTAMRTALPAEPSTGEANCVKVSLKFPTGERVERRFRSGDSLRLLYDFTFSHDQCPDDFSIVEAFPRRTLPPCAQNSHAVTEITFAEAGLDKAVMLLVLNNEA